MRPAQIVGRREMESCSRNDGGQAESLTASRKRPLRTYGRRSQLSSERDSEPPSKKRAIESNSCSATSTDGDKVQFEPGSPSSPQLPKLPAPPPVMPPVKRGTILAFFKPASAPPSSSAPQSQISSDVTRDEEARSSPPSSPPLLSRSLRTRRRLRTRINTVGSLKDDERQTEGEAKRAEKGVVSQGDEGDAQEATAMNLEPSTILQELRFSLLNSGTPTDDPAGEMFKVKHEAKRRARQPTVQTTLNLSMADDPAFTICKDCEMLYNPLNEKDRKDHARRHAAVMRRKGGVTV